MKQKFILGISMVVMAVLAVSVSFAQSVPDLINYQGRLMNSSGQPLDGDTVDLTFAFYGAASGGTAYLTVLQENVLVTSGIYNVLIGSGTVTPGAQSSLSAVFQTHKDVWMGTKVDADPEMTPRSKISSTPYAMTVDASWLDSFMSATDYDGDGFAKLLHGGTDCNDNNPLINPAATEICDDGFDNDCDALIDSDDPDCWITPYTSDPNTIILDHFDDSTLSAINAYTYTGPSGLQPSCTPNYAWVSGPEGLSNALELSPPIGEPENSATYLVYPGDWPLSVANGTIEFWVYVTAYGSLVDQGPYYNSPGGWTFGMYIDASGILHAGAWAAFNMDSGSNNVPLNDWTHVAATWGSTGAKLYIDGVEVGNDPITSAPATGYSAKLMLKMGSYLGSNRIDELRVSNIQRTTFNVH